MKFSLTKINTLILSLSSLLLFSQYTMKFQPPKTPDVYQMEKYGNQEINLYTGRPNITIPITSIKYGEINFPINISYNSNGIRADEESSRVGLGWYMETPMVVQIVNGYDDLAMELKTLDYYYNYKYSYLIEPQPDYYYSYYPAASSSTNIERLNKYINLKSNPWEHLNDYFIAKTKDDGGGFFNSINKTFFPINGSMFGLDLTPEYLVGYGNEYDIEKDLFKATFYGETVIFYKIPNQNQFVILNKKNYKIEKNNIGTNNSWIITNPSGVKYYFEKEETTNSPKEIVSSSSPGYNTTNYVNADSPSNIPTYSLDNLPSNPVVTSRQWKITKITDKNNNEVNFQYENLQTATRLYNNISGKCLFLNANIINESFDNAHPVSNAKKFKKSPYQILNSGLQIKCIKEANQISKGENSIISNIIFGSSKIVFNSSSRQDNIYDKKFDSIEVINNNKRVEVTKLITDYYPNDHLLAKRLKLNSIEINNKKYSFEYKNIANISKYIDYWGYFNGLPNTTPYVNPFRFYKNISDIPQWSLPLYQQTKDSENKSAHPENIKIGILEKIIYPTGGYSKFEYELNTFNNYFFPNYDNKITVNKNNFAINHLNIDTNFSNRSTPLFNVSNGDIINGTIKLTNGISGTCQYSNSSFKMVKVPADWVTQYNSGVTGRENFWYVVDNGYIPVETIYLKTGFTSLNDFNFSINITSDAVVAARVKFDSSCPTTGSPIGNINATFGSSKYIDYQQDYSTGYGLRVKEISDYDENGLALKKRFKYTGGKHISPFRPINDSDNFEASTYSLQSNGNANPLHVYSSVLGKKIEVYNNTFFQTNLLGNGDYVGYDMVEIEEISGNTTKGKHLYYFTNKEDVKPSDKFGTTDGITSYELDKFGIGIRTNDIDNGLLIKEEIKDSNSQIIKRIDQNYIADIFYDANSCFNTKVLFIDSEMSLVSTPILIGGYDNVTFNNHNFYYYPLKGRESLLSSSMITEYLNGKEVKTQTDFNYDNFNLLNSKSILTQSADQISENYSYSSMIPRLKNVNILSENIGKTIYKNGKQILNQAIKYDDVNHYNPTSIITYELNSANINIPSDVTYDKYDLKGNLQQYTTKDGVSTTIIWGYNQTQPIAKIQGAKVSDIQQSFIDSIVNASDTDAMAIPGNDESTFLTILDNFRKDSSFLNYQITTYTYDPLIGVRSITPPSGIREVYIYDSANRLKEVRENNQTGKLLKEFQYNYKH